MVWTKVCLEIIVGIRMSSGRGKECVQGTSRIGNVIHSIS